MPLQLISTTMIESPKPPPVILVPYWESLARAEAKRSDASASLSASSSSPSSSSASSLAVSGPASTTEAPQPVAKAGIQDHQKHREKLQQNVYVPSSRIHNQKHIDKKTEMKKIVLQAVRYPEIDQRGKRVGFLHVPASLLLLDEQRLRKNKGYGVPIVIHESKVPAAYCGYFPKSGPWLYGFAFNNLRPSDILDVSSFEVTLTNGVSKADSGLQKESILQFMVRLHIGSLRHMRVRSPNGKSTCLTVTSDDTIDSIKQKIQDAATQQKKRHVVTEVSSDASNEQEDLYVAVTNFQMENMLMEFVPIPGECAQITHAALESQAAACFARNIFPPTLWTMCGFRPSLPHVTSIA